MQVESSQGTGEVSGEDEGSCLGQRRGGKHSLLGGAGLAPLENTTSVPQARLLGESRCDLYFVREGMAEVEGQLLGQP